MLLIFGSSKILTLFVGWCGEIRDVIFAENGSVTVVYRVTVRGSDGEVCSFSYCLKHHLIPDKALLHLIIVGLYKVALFYIKP